jgi:CysZ protein
MKGFYCFISGIGLMFRPGIFRYAMWPLIINIIIFTLLGIVAYYQFEGLLAWMLSYLPGWLDWLRYLLWPIFSLALAFVFFFTFTLVANLVASPFNAPLANAVEQHLGKVSDSAGSGTPFVRSVLNSVLSELRKMLYILLRAIPILILFVIPVVNIAAPFIWIVFSAWMLTMEYADYPMGNHELDFKSQLAYLKKRRFLSLGFGATVSIALLVPVLNFLVMPAAVAGATKMWVEDLSIQK